jgi:hypothetical protein
MRLMRRFAASFWLTIGVTGSAALGLGAVTAMSGPALAATVNSPGNTVASVVPATVTPGTRVTFAVACASVDSSSATLFGQTLGLPEQIPMQSGAASGDFVITVTLPASILPGTYHPDIDCSDGTSTNVALHVTQLPRGGAQTGDGTTSTTTNNGLAAGGLVLIGVGAVAGGIAMRRRSGRRS